jgi:rubrerythrin
MDELDEFEIDCDICGMGSVVHAYDPPDFCPMCGRRAIPVLNNSEYGYLEDE